MIDARRYAKLGGTRAEQTASIGSDFASVTGKQTNSSTPELRLGIDPEGGVQSAPRDFFHSCAARGSPSHEARGTRGRADYTWRGLSSATRLLDYSRWPTMQRPPTLPRMSGFEPNPSIHPSVHYWKFRFLLLPRFSRSPRSSPSISLRGIVSPGHSARI